MIVFPKYYEKKNKQMLHRNIKEKILKEEIPLEGCRYRREWEIILDSIRRNMPEDRPKEQVVVKESAEVKSSVRLRKRRLPRMVEEH